EKVGLKPTRFHDVPIISALTCTCAETSEHYNDSACTYRRRPDFGEIFIPGQEIFVIDSLFKIPNGEEAQKIPCTLMGDGNLNKVEQVLQLDYRHRMTYPYPTFPLIDTIPMRAAREYYENLGIHL
ncbi:MAG: hypothetical protein Q7S61_04525, partial [bacterium]|nr:hypothetical protein [bacterium]